MIGNVGQDLEEAPIRFTIGGMMGAVDGQKGISAWQARRTPGFIGR
jgi:hypothetical protein